jgi:hypothetical protein
LLIGSVSFYPYHLFGEELIYISGDLLVICAINKHASIIASRYHTATPPFYEKFNAFIHEVKIAEENGGASINFAEPPVEEVHRLRRFLGEVLSSNVRRRAEGE